jgi:MFS family permease
MRPFTRLFAASVLSNVGDGVVLTAFPLLAAGLSSSPQAVAALTAAATLPWLLFGLPAGVFVDRLDRVKLMWIVDAGRALIVGALAIVIVNDQIGLAWLYGVVFLLGVSETLFDTAAMSVLPSLVEDSALEKANGRLFAGQLVSNRFVGPPLGAILFGVAAALPAGIDAVTFAVSAVLLVGIRIEPGPAAARVERRSILSELREGLAWLWGQPNIRAMAIGAAVINLSFTGALAVLVLFAREDLGLSDFGYGALYVAMAAGALIGSLNASRVSKRIGRRRTVIGSVMVMSVSLLAIGVFPVVVVVAVGMMTISMVAEFWNVVAVSYRQHATPDRLRGRVMSAYRFIAYGSFPVGAMFGGWVATVAGIPMAYVIGGLMIGGLAVFLVRSLGDLD